MKSFISKRGGEILNILIHRKDPITIDHIAKKLNVSNRTIRNDLNELEEHLNMVKKGGIVRKPGVGVWIDIEESEKVFLENIIRRNKGYAQPFSTQERQLYILRRLLQANNSITMQLLADEIYVSRITIYKDLVEVEKFLTRYNLKLERKQNYGIEIVGSEKDWRRATADLFSILKNDKELKNILSETQGIHSKGRVNLQNYMQLNELFPNINARRIEELLSEAEKTMNFRLDDEAFECLLAHIVISIERINQKKDIQMHQKQLETIKKHKEFHMARWISQRIEKEFHIDMPEAEVGYISLHILGSKVNQNYNLENTTSILRDMDKKIINLSKDIIELIGSILSVDFSNDEKFLTGLALHLRTVVNRLKYNLSLRNPILADIKDKYPSVFGAAWATSTLFEKHFGIQVNEDEIGFIAIHIGAALERLNNTIRAVIVCSSGIGTAQLVALRLEKSIPDLEIVAVTSSYAFEHFNQNDFDMLITTLPHIHSLKPVIKINPLVNENDIKKIKTYINNVKGKYRVKKQEDKNYMRDLFNERLILQNIKAETKEEVINTLGNLLVKHKYVEVDFINSALDREKIAPTYVGNGVAIPHGIQKYVSKSAIAIAILGQPIRWSKNKVDLVFLLALGDDLAKTTRIFFRRFYSIIDDEKILSQIKNGNSPETIYNILIRGGGENE